MGVRGQGFQNAGLIEKEFKSPAGGADVECGFTVFGSTQAAARRRAADPAIMLRGTLHWSAPGMLRVRRYGAGCRSRFDKHGALLAG